MEHQHRPVSAAGRQEDRNEGANISAEVGRPALAILCVPPITSAVVYAARTGEPAADSWPAAFIRYIEAWDHADPVVQIVALLIVPLTVLAYRISATFDVKRRVAELADPDA